MPKGVRDRRASTGKKFVRKKNLSEKKHFGRKNIFSEKNKFVRKKIVVEKFEQNKFGLEETTPKSSPPRTALFELLVGRAQGFENFPGNDKIVFETSGNFQNLTVFPPQGFCPKDALKVFEAKKAHVLGEGGGGGLWCTIYENLRKS